MVSVFRIPMVGSLTAPRINITLIPKISIATNVISVLQSMAITPDVSTTTINALMSQEETIVL